MKFVKRVAVFLVLCLAIYGAFSLINDINKPVIIDVSTEELVHLRGLGIDIQDGQAAESGQSALFGGIEGLPPIGASMDMSSETSGTSAPPVFMRETTSTFAPPAFLEAAPRVATANAAVNATANIETLSPAPTLETPVTVPQDIIPQNNVVPVDSFIPAPSFDAPAIPLETSSPQSIEVQTMESPPPLDSWDGPILDISNAPPPQDCLVYSNSYSTPQDVFTGSTAPAVSPIPQELTVDQQIIEHVPLENGVRRIHTESPIQSPLESFSSSDITSVNIAAAANTGYASTEYSTTAAYTRTSARQPLAFKTVAAESDPNSPVLTFSAPKRPVNPQAEMTPPASIQQPVFDNTTAANTSVRQIGTPEHVEHHTAQHIIPGSVSSNSIDQNTVVQFVRLQQQMVESGNPEQIRSAFIQLSQLNEQKFLSNSDREVIRPLLDLLARNVIYARDSHILEPPYQVKQGETIESIAQSFSITPAFLGKVNGIAPSQALPPATRLKVVFGQFDAQISLQRNELTLLLGGLYAGSFPFRVAQSAIPSQGSEFLVTHKTEQLLALNNGWIFGTEYTKNATFIFAEKDIRELLDILSKQSVVVLE